MLSLNKQEFPIASKINILVFSEIYLKIDDFVKPIRIYYLNLSLIVKENCLLFYHKHYI